MDQAVKFPSVAVIGAGMAGISCAVSLVQSGCSVTVFEKAEYPGGRMASKEYGGYQFDSGAQYFTVRNDAFRQQAERWCEQWLLDEWRVWLVDLQQGQAMSHEDDVVRYVGRPAMHSIVEDMAELCQVRYQTEIKKLKYQKRDKQWLLIDSRNNKLGSFDVVICALPAPQAAVLLKPAKDLAKLAGQVNMTSCWSVMLAFEQSLQLGFDGAYVVSDKLSWIAKDSAKMERDSIGQEETWVLHAAPEWSDQNIKLSNKKVIAQLLGYMSEVAGREIPAPKFATAELWPHAKPLNPLQGTGHLYDANMRIGACGDWCHSAKVEGAYLSGVSLAGKVLQHV